MSSTDATSQDSSDTHLSSISLANQTAHLHNLPLVLDPALLPEHSKHTDIPLSASSDESLHQLPLVQLDDEEVPIVAMKDDTNLDVDEDEDFSEEIAPEDLALVFRTRNRQPPPGATRVHKIVRVRKHQSSSKRRTKKHTLRVQLKEKDRIEEEMAQFRGKGKGKPKERPIPERRYFPADPSSRGPSGLRFSESCCYDEEEEGKRSATPPRDPKMSTERQRTPPPPLESDPDTQINQKAQSPQAT